MLNKFKAVVKERSPDWLYAVIMMSYWAINGKKYPLITLYPSKGDWIASYRGKRFCVPTPRSGVEAHFVGSYRRVYGRFFWVEEGEIVLDVGAYAGSFAMEASSKAKRVLSIEPDARSYRCLTRNTSALSNVKVVNMGIWNEKTTLKLYVDPQCPIANSIVIPPSGQKYIQIEVDTLDNIAKQSGFDHVDFIKINVEGAELEALQGMEQLLKSAKKLVMDAHHVRNGQPTWPFVCKFMEERGFKTFVDEEIEAVYAWKEEGVSPLV